jgi:hypothetical protein
MRRTPHGGSGSDHSHVGYTDTLEVVLLNDVFIFNR